MVRYPLQRDCKSYQGSKQRGILLSANALSFPPALQQQQQLKHPVVPTSHWEVPRIQSLAHQLPSQQRGCLWHRPDPLPAKPTSPASEGAAASLYLLPLPRELQSVYGSLSRSLKPSQPGAFCFTQMHLSALIKSKHCSVLCIFTHDPVLHCQERKQYSTTPRCMGAASSLTHTKHCVIQPLSSAAPPLH